LLQLSCSSKSGLNPVQGKVLYQNEPLGGALVSFHPDGPPDVNLEPPVGLTKADGTFQLATGKDDGARAGHYTVTIICSEIPKTAQKGFSTGGVESVDRLKGAYANMETSKIKVEIKSGSNQLEPFDLK
jgi:hypothetical protein